jgi:hypothetical protein
MKQHKFEPGQEVWVRGNVTGIAGTVGIVIVVHDLKDGGYLKVEAPQEDVVPVPGPPPEKQGNVILSAEQWQRIEASLRDVPLFIAQLAKLKPLVEGLIAAGDMLAELEMTGERVRAWDAAKRALEE